jgi:predicted NAD/FAD-dependent oxidoreductase
MNEDYDVVIVGAGIAGLVAASRLRDEGFRVLVLDKGRGVGGRMATRRTGDAVLDHGAQFITVRDPRFRSMMDAWLEAGAAREWCRGFAGADLSVETDGHPRYCGASGMTAIPKHLAENLPVRCDVRVTAVGPSDDGWRIETEGGEAVTGAALVLTPPVPQSLALLEAGGSRPPKEISNVLRGIQYDPCLAALAVLDAPSGLPEPGGVQTREEPVAWVADNRMKGISPGAHAVTVHAGPEFSRSRWESDEECIAGELLEFAARWVKGTAREVEVMKWRYSKPVRTTAEPCLVVEDPALLVWAGDAFAGPRVEGAALSGLEAAARVTGRIQPRGS